MIHLISEMAVLSTLAQFQRPTSGDQINSVLLWTGVEVLYCNPGGPVTYHWIYINISILF